MNQSLKDATLSVKNDIVDFTQRLIQTPSLSGDEELLAELVLAELRKLNYDYTFVDGIGNVVGIMYGKDSDKNTLFSSHMDHNNPEELDLWEYSPYSGEIENNRIHGIGASDSKGAIASQIYAGALLKKHNLLNKNNYIVSCVVRENSAGYFGTKYLFEKTFQHKNLPINYVILGNATSLNIYIGQRGRVEFELATYGKTAHSGISWTAINATHKILPVIKSIEDLIDTLPSHPMLDRATLAITNIETFPKRASSIPDKCVIKINRSFLPNESIEEVKGQLQAIINKFTADDHNFKATLKINSSNVTSYTGFSKEIPKLIHPFITDESSPLVKNSYVALKELHGNINFGTWYFSTDGGYTSNILKIPTIGYSPGEEKYFNTPFDLVNINHLMTATSGNIAIYLSL